MRKFLALPSGIDGKYLLLHEQSDQGLHCLPLIMIVYIFFDIFLCGTLIKF